MASYLLTMIGVATLGGLAGAQISGFQPAAIDQPAQIDVAATYLKYAEQRGLAAGGLYACSKTLDENEQRQRARFTYREQLDARITALVASGAIEAGQRTAILAAYWQGAEAPRGTACFETLTDLSQHEADRLWALLNGSSVEG